MGKPRLYRGFKITILDSRRYSFRYEWKIEAETPTAKALLLRNYKKEKSLVLRDPTSGRVAAWAEERAMQKVNEMCSPFWYKIWHY